MTRAGLPVGRAAPAHQRRSQVSALPTQLCSQCRHWAQPAAGPHRHRPCQAQRAAGGHAGGGGTVPAGGWRSEHGSTQSMCSITLMPAELTLDCGEAALLRLKLGQLCVSPCPSPVPVAPPPQALPVKDLPGVGWSTGQKLESRGITTVADVLVGGPGVAAGRGGTALHACLVPQAAGLRRAAGQGLLVLPTPSPSA